MWNLIKYIFLIYISAGLLLLLWDMRYRLLAWLFRFSKHNNKANIESPLYVNKYGIARLKMMIIVVFIWPIRICVSIRRILRTKHLAKKETKTNVLEDFFEQVHKTHFPGGNKQINDQIRKIIKLSNDKLNFEKAQSMLLRGKGMLSINKSMVYDSIKSNSGGALDKDELKKITAFIIFDTVNESTIKLVEVGFNTEELGYNEDEIPTGNGEFGRCSTNPIPVNGIMMNDAYLEKLRTINNKKIKWERKGPAEPKIEGVTGTIDVYNIFDENNNNLGELYISSYNQRLSKKAPAGFIIEGGTIVNSNEDLQDKINRAHKYKEEGKLIESIGTYNQVYDFYIKEATEFARRSDNAIVNKGTTRKINPEYFLEAEKYLKRDNVVCTILNNMGVIFAELDDKENAKKYFEEAIKLTPNGLDYQEPKIGLKNLE